MTLSSQIIRYAPCIAVVFWVTLLQVDGLRAQSAQSGSVEAGEIYFVFGSDTSTPGIDVNHRTALYHASGFDLFASPTGNAARAMDDAFRAANTDSYGEPLKMTWWMQAGSLYGAAENTNVPLASTMSPFLMRRYHGDAVERLGDEFTFHYHTWVWTDYNGDGRFFWNQARTFPESLDDFDRTMAEMLLDEDVFPVSFRSGWHFMDNAWQAHIDRLIPFNLHNEWPVKGVDVDEPIDNLLDWSRAPEAFVPFHPSLEDYQRPGDGASWTARSMSVNRATDARIRQAFEEARSGGDRVVCIWGHLADPPFVDDIQGVIDRIAEVAADYPDVRFRYTTAVEAMQRWLRTSDQTPPHLVVDEVVRAAGTALRITSDEPIFQRTPFVAIKDRFERRLLVGVTEVAALTWETETFDPKMTAVIRVAATDTVGNLSKHTFRYLPDDLIVDNSDDGFMVVAGDWRTIGSRQVDHVWGTDIVAASLAEGEDAVARWSLPVGQAATYNAFVRIPDVGPGASNVHMELHAGGAVVASRSFDARPPANTWLYVGTAHLEPAEAPVIEVRASGDGQAGSVLAVDAVKISALVRERQLGLGVPELNLPDVVAGDTMTVFLPVRNLGVGTLTITEIAGSSDVLVSKAPLPFSVEGPVQAQLPLFLTAGEIGTVRDTLIVRSDDPIMPLQRLPYSVDVRDYFIIADNEDPAGYVEQGGWSTSVAQAHGNSSRFVFVPNGTGASATFRMRVDRDGVFDAAFIVPRTVNAAVRADYEIRVDGSMLDAILVDQNVGSGSWRSLGLYELDAGSLVEVTVRAADADQPDRVLRADAFRLSRLGDLLQADVLDDADPPHYRETGVWSTSVAEAYGTSSRFAYWGNDSRASFHTVATVTGLHAFEEIVPTTDNATDRARYRVLRNGSLVESLIVNQNVGSGAWRALGAWLFNEGDDIEVEVSDAATTNSALVLRADALRVSYGIARSTASEADVPARGASLGANFPNPFATTTRFRYTLGAADHVSVELFDMLGRRVAVVEDGFQNAGEHTVRFDASGLSSGSYLCRLVTGDYRESRTWTIAK